MESTKTDPQIKDLDFSNLTPYKEECIYDIIKNFGQDLLNDLCPDQKIADLDFKNLTNLQKEGINKVLKTLAKILIEHMQNDGISKDTRKKGLYIEKENYSEDELIEEIKNFTEDGLYFLRLESIVTMNTFQNRNGLEHEKVKIPLEYKMIALFRKIFPPKKVQIMKMGNL